MANANVFCPVCGSTASKTYMTDVTDLFHGVRGIWELLECVDCGLIYTTPFIPENRIGEYYPADYAPYSEGVDASARPIIRFLKSLAILPYKLRFGEPGYFPLPFGNSRLMEVGCGAGRYLHKMSSLSWQCTGLDISAQAIEVARKSNPDAEFIVGALNDIAAGESYDMIIMHHVFEHLYHPKQVIETCFKLLQHGGKLVVSGPNIDSLEAKCFGRRWKGLDMPRHTLHFKESVLIALLKDAGFTIENTRPGMFASSISESLIMCLPEKFRRKVIHSRFERMIYLILTPIAAISYFLGNRGTVEVVAIKN